MSIRCKTLNKEMLCHIEVPCLVTQSIVKKQVPIYSIHTGSKAEEEETTATKSTAVLRWKFLSFTKSALPPSQCVRSSVHQPNLYRQFHLGYLFSLLIFAWFYRIPAFLGFAFCLCLAPSDSTPHIQVLNGQG